MSRYPKTDLSPVLKSHNLAEATTTLLELDQNLQIIPKVSHQALLDGIETLIKHAGDLQLTNLDEVVRESTTLIASASGVMRARHQQFLKAADAEPLHLYRNLLLALTMSAVIDYRGDASSIAARFPALKPRSSSLRPHTDDETLLVRLWALHLSNGDKNNRRAAAVYAQCDAGLLAGETTMVKGDDVALDPGKGLIQAPGHRGGVKDRLLHLDDFGVEILQRYLRDTNLAPDALLTYRPRKNTSYGAASSSAMGVIDRIRTAVGLKHDDTNSASVWMWRADTTQRLHGLKAAVEASGRSSEDNLRGQLRNAKNSYKKPRVNGKRRTLDDI